jgi:hypothetical protein
MTEEQKWKFTDTATAIVVFIIASLFTNYKMNEWLPNKVEKDPTLVSTESFLCGKDIAKWVCQLKDVYLTSPSKINIKPNGQMTYETLWLMVYRENKVTDMNHSLVITEADSKVLYEIWENLKNKRSREEVDLKSYEQ